MFRAHGAAISTIVAAGRQHRASTLRTIERKEIVKVALCLALGLSWVRVFGFITDPGSATTTFVEPPANRIAYRGSTSRRAI
jgi:hypothetical protein